MRLDIFFTDDEIKRFFEANGFEMEVRDFGEWKPAYHNDREYVKTPRPAVVINGKQVEARKLFDQIAEKRIRKMLTPVNMESKRMIADEFKNMQKQ